MSALASRFCLPACHPFTTSPPLTLSECILIPPSISLFCARLWTASCCLTCWSCVMNAANSTQLWLLAAYCPWNIQEAEQSSGHQWTVNLQANGRKRPWLAPWKLLRGLQLQVQSSHAMVHSINEKMYTSMDNVQWQLCLLSHFTAKSLP